MNNSKRFEYFKVKYNQVSMMLYRGYQIPDNELFFTKKQSNTDGANFIRDNYENVAIAQQKPINDLMSNVYYRVKTVGNKNISDRVVVNYLPTLKTGKALGVQDITPYLQKFTEIANNDDNISLIFIAPVKLSIPAANNLSTNVQKYRIELFYHNSLMTNPTRYFLNSPMRILNEEEIKLLIADTGIDPADMRELPTDDPMARYLGAIEGDIVEITRENTPIDILENKNVSWSIVVDKEIFENSKKKMEMIKGKLMAEIELEMEQERF